MASATTPIMCNSGRGPLRVPGFGGVPVFFQHPANIRFAHGFNEWRQSPLVTAQEKAMVIIMDRLTDKPGWSESVFDDDIVAQWRTTLEAERVETRECEDTHGRTAADVFLSNPRLLRGATWDWCVRELRDKARDYKERGRVRVLDTGTCACKIDSIDLGTLVLALRRGVELMATAATEPTEHYCKTGAIAKVKAEVKMALNLKALAPSDFLAVTSTIERWPEMSDDSLVNWQWKPSHNGRVRDINGSAHMIQKIVDPLKFPLVYGRSLVLQDGGTVSLDDIFGSYAGATIPPRPDMSVPKRRFGIESDGSVSDEDAWCKKYQCLPFDIEFNLDIESNAKTTPVRVTSYINDIHPDYKDVYAAIENTLSHCIEPWNDCIIPGHQDAYNSDISCQLGRVPLRIVTFGAEYSSSNSEGFKHPEPGTAFSYDEWKSGQHGNRAIIEELPLRERGWCGHDMRRGREAQKKGPPDTENCAFLPLQEHFRDKGLQVFAEIQSIELTPDEPAYAPDAADCSAAYTAVAARMLKKSLAENKPLLLNRRSANDGWRIPGRLNEHVVAVAVFVVDADNITAPRIAFHQKGCGDNNAYDQRVGNSINCTGVLGEIYNLSQSGRFPHLMTDADQHQLPMSLNLLSPGPEPDGTGPGSGRLLTFPSVMQHRIEPFELRDATRPGRLRWLTLYLVDPNYRLCSTRNVPPQNHDWWTPPVRRLLAQKLPPELVDDILSRTKVWPLDDDEVQNHRKEFSVLTGPYFSDPCCRSEVIQQILKYDFSHRQNE